MNTKPELPWELAGELLPSRRSFLKTSTLTAAGLAMLRWPVMAGPFTREDFDRLVPADKKLRPEWVKSLFERGERTVRSEEHTSELQSLRHLVCRLLLE